MAGHDERSIVEQAGGWTVEYAVRKEGNIPAKVFVEELPPKLQRHIRAVFRHVAENKGKNVSPDIFAHERDEIWTFKCKLNKRRIRLPCFQKGTRWIITHGFVKPPKSKWPEQEFTLAFQIMREVVARESKSERQPKRNY